jgi:hypothetical protein
MTRRRSTTWLFLLLLLATALPVVADGDLRTQSESVPAEGVTALEIDLPVGQLLLEGGDGNAVDATMSVRCDRERCRDQADQIRLATERKGGLLKLKVEGLSRGTATGFEVKLRITTPRSLAAEIDLGVGEVRVRGLAADLEIDLGVGDVEVEMARADVKSVHLDAGVGEARLSTDLGEIRGSGVVGSALKWSQGTGTAAIEIDTGVGEIFVALR